MKKILLLSVGAVFAVALAMSCNKKVTPCTNGFTLAQDRHIIDSTIDKNGWAAVTWNETKNFYSGNLIVGAGSMPKDDSLITFDIVSKYISGNTIVPIDSTRYPRTNQPQGIQLKELNNTANKGLYDVLSKMQEGGLYKEILPSSKAYGCAGMGVIPANVQLMTDIRLVDVKKP